MDRATVRVTRGRRILLAMLVSFTCRLHPCSGRRLTGFEFYDFVVPVRRQNSNESHHAPDVSAPTCGQAVRLRFIDFSVPSHHRTLHEGVLRKERNLIGIFRQFRHAHCRHGAAPGFGVIHSGHTGHRLLRFGLGQGAVGPRHIACRADAEAAPQARSFVLGRRAAFSQHAHGFLHAPPRPYALTESRHRADVRSHLVHHVMGKMAVEHPIADSIGYEFDIPSLSDTNKRCIASGPDRLGLPRSLPPRLPKREPVEMNRMVIHAKVDHADAHPFAVTDDERCRRRA